ncbi:hypothetical protein HYH03_001135 [Edaphochlamys debaryana]|uniref:Uncharacterized protein ycf33 n=1 Tax=Edaphochlamys debaryana TaxID=47281 RepID=A0A835YEG2_9CHLO|nr:hypothetical protein HYH03_001135 [Edaphochlamys debaryana]|eukprot:KAG2501345.1 hypothetical protein HYH03_001135 [Edaphochlamys debaryana]
MQTSTTLRAPRPFSVASRRIATRSQLQLARVAAPRAAPSNSGSECSTSGSDGLWWTSLASLDLAKAQPVTTAAILMMGLAATAGAASAADIAEVHAQALPLAEHAQPMYDVAEEFWGNLARYGRYFVTVMLGTGYVMLRPLQAMFKRPVTAIFGILALVGLVYGTRVALELMLGIETYAYDPDTFKIVTGYD